MEQLDKAAIIGRYRSQRRIWADSWHSVTGERIRAVVARLLSPYANLLPHWRVLNAGSAGDAYDVEAELHVHVDIAAHGLRHAEFATYGDIEQLPFASNSFDFCLCVGSVLNYCNLVESLLELDRVLCPGALLLVEFERSDSYEYLFTPEYKANAAIVESWLDGSPERIWIYSEDFVVSILRRLGYRIVNQTRFHSLSPLAYRILRNEAIAAKFAALDGFAEWFRMLSRGATNVAILCRSRSL